MSKIILGIHGLGNKPPKKTLARWWKDSMREGLKAIGHPRRFFPFKLVYWTNFFYPELLDPTIRDKNNPLHVGNPYTPARTPPQKKRRTIGKRFLDYLQRQLAKVILNEDFSINYTSVTDLVIRRYFKDLDTYYSKQCPDRHNALCPAKHVIREELARMLRKYRKKDILLISHSMGSIIAYDVLTYSVPDIPIHTLVTMGSPLGLPLVMLKIVAEQGKKPKKHITVKTPENIVHAWYNFSDLKDKVATDYTLSEDYEANARGIRAVDAVVVNNYEYQGNPNPHNVYGYLRTPEVAHVIHNFLHAGRPRAATRLLDRIDRVMNIARRHKR